MLIGLFFALAQSARAADSSSLSWVRLDGAESCIAAPALAQAVEAELHHPVFLLPGAADLTVEGRAERVDGGAVHWRAVVRLSDRAGVVLGERIVESQSESCDELGRAVAVSIALLIDPIGVPPEPEAAPPTTPPPAPLWAWGVEGSVVVGNPDSVVPGWAIGGIGSVRLTPPGLFPFVAFGELIPFARYDGAYSFDGGYYPGPVIDVTRFSGGIQACPLVFERGAFGLYGCLGIEVGALLVLESDVELDATEWVLVQARGSLRGRWTVVGPLSVAAGLHPIVPFRQVSINLADDPVSCYVADYLHCDQVWAAAPFAYSADLGLGLDF